MMRPRTVLLILLLAAGCSGNANLFLIEPPAPTVHVPNRLGQVEVRDVLLPEYASAPEIAVQQPDGSLRAMKNSLWADTPDKGITRALASQISLVSGANAVASPWPLSEPPDRTLDVRIDQLLARTDGQFVLSGQYFVSAYGGGGDVTRRFTIAVPIPNTTAAAVSSALSIAIQQLALKIAKLG